MVSDGCNKLKLFLGLVLILVLMEDGLGRVDYVYHFPGHVLILVLMEDGLGPHADTAAVLGVQPS